MIVEKSSVLVPVILCGGVGSRLWPVSRDFHPKPFIRLANGQSLLQQAWLRGAMLSDVPEILTVTNRELFFKTEDEYREITGTANQGMGNNFILEPFGRNTAAAIAAAALQVAASYGDDAVLLVLAADHLIADQAAFVDAVARAKILAQAGKLVTFGVTPEGPETGFGYIEASGNSVLRFVEKPSLKKAKEYLDSGNYLWNSGMFCFTAGSLMQEMEKYCPNILTSVRLCMDKARRAEGKGFKQIEIAPEDFDPVPSDSVDYAVMEKSKNVAVVPCSMGWSDIGSWQAIGDLISADENGNRIQGEAALHNVTNCFIQSNGRVVGAVGINDLLVIDTPDALLVADRKSAQDVKYIYAKLKLQGHEAHKLHRTVHRPWGTYTVLESGRQFKIKRIEVKPGGSLSLQMHHHRSEHWIVVSGMARVVNGEQVILVKTNESTFIPAGNKHRLENPGILDLVMIEVQSGEYLGEDDIVRFEDVYGRVTSGVTKKK